MDGLLTIYMASAIFGGGVIAVDMLGMLGNLGEEGDEDGDAAHGDHTDDGGGDDDGDDGDESDDAHTDDMDAGKGSVIMHDRSNSKKLILRSIAALKTLVYFAFGFGTTGWFALSVADKADTESLLWGGGVGIVIAAAARIVKRLQRNEFDSSFKTTELLMEEAEVTVPIQPGGIGKIRIHYNNIYIDRFAKGENPHTSFVKGERVRVVNITDEYFFIE